MSTISQESNARVVNVPSGSVHCFPTMFLSQAAWQRYSNGHPITRWLSTRGYLSIYLHHGRRNAVYFDLVGRGPHGELEYIEVIVYSRFPSNCFWAARTAVSELLDAMMRTMWLPLTIRRLDLFLDGDDEVLC